jgi:hypothetical protein
MRITPAIPLLAAVTLALSSAATPAIAKDRRGFAHVVVQNFELPADSEFPAFRTVPVLDGGQTVPADADISLTGKIVRFKKGNRAERYMAPGLGATSVREWIEFAEPCGGRSLLKKEVSGKVVIGVRGGDSQGASNRLAKGLAKSVKKSLP